MTKRWLSEAEMNALLPETYSGQIKQADGTFADVTFVRVGTYNRDLGGNNTNMIVTWFSENVPQDQYGRFISRYNASVSGITLPPNPLDRIIKVTIPLYTSNVKYLEVPMLGWVDLEAAPSLSYDTSHSGSFVTYNRNSVRSKIYCLPSTDGTKIGTTRINNNEGVSIFRNLFEINEELGDQPISVDFLEMQYMCCYSESGVVSFWISQIHINDDATFPDTPVPESGNWGEDSTSGGGNGTFQVTQDNLTPADISIDVRRDRFNDVFNNGGINIYQINTMNFGTIIGILYGSDFWDKFKNSMYNPLSAVLSCHLLPSNLRGDTLTGRDKHLTLAGFDVSAKMSNPINFPLISSMCRYVVGSFDFNNPRYSDSFTDFAPNTIAILHLPYIGECEIDVNAFMYGTLTLEYVCDNISGNCAAWVWNVDRNGNGRLKYVFTGNCATNVPLFSMSQDGAAVGRVAAQAVIGIGAIALGIGLTAATGGIGAGALALGGVSKRIGARTLASAAVGGLALGATKAATDGISTTQHLQSTGGVSGNAGALGDFSAWLEIIRPVWSNPMDYQELNGLPSNTSTKLSSCLGFTQVTSIEIEGCTATAEEVEELKSILESGIIIKSV